MGKHNVIWGGVLFVLGAAIFALIPGQIKNVGGSAVGPRAFPYFLSVLLMICSGGLALQSLVRRKKTEEDSSEGSQKGVLFALGIFVLFFLYARVMRWIGYVPASFVFLAILLYLLGVRKKGLYVLMIPIVLCVYAVFRMILHVQLP